MIRALPILLLALPAAAQIDWGAVASVTLPTGEVASIAIDGETVWTRPNPLPYDEEVVYIESTGTQVIDTGFVPVPGMGMTLVFEVTTDTPNSKYFFGSVAGWNADRFAIFHQSHDGKFAFYASPSSGSAVAACPQGSKLSFVLAENGSVAFAGTSKTLDTSTINCTLPLALFGRRGSIAKYYDFFPGLRIYSCTITQNGVLVRDFIPVRSGAEYCLYDRVSGALFRNAGSGSFLGPDKP